MIFAVEIKLQDNEMIIFKLIQVFQISNAFQIVWSILEVELKRISELYTTIFLPTLA